MNYFTYFLRKILLISLITSAVAQVTFPNSVFKNLDYGLYWFGDKKAQKAIKGQSNSYYKSSRKTVIYIHGWQVGSSQSYFRETLYRYESQGPKKDLADYWRAKGYNVGILYWNQFADEYELKDAEAKIYTAKGPRKMRWRSSNGSYKNGPSSSVTDILYKSLVDGMPQFKGSELRIVGHSLGNQLALKISEKLNNAVDQDNLSSYYKPDRIALLDPFYSIGKKGYLSNKWPGEVALQIAKELKKGGVVLEAYRSSAVANTFVIGDENRPLMNETAFVQLKPWNFRAWQVAEKHSAAVTHYFWSLNFQPRTLYYNSTQVPSSRASTSVVKKWMNANKGAIQHNGAWTSTPSDDDFKNTRRL